MRGCGETTKITITHIDAYHPIFLSKSTRPQSQATRSARATCNGRMHSMATYRARGTQGAGHTGRGCRARGAERGVQSVGCRAWGCLHKCTWRAWHPASHKFTVFTHTHAHTRTHMHTHRMHHMHHMHHTHHTHLFNRVRQRTTHEEETHVCLPLGGGLVWGGHGLLLMVVFPLCGRCDFFFRDNPHPFSQP